jgi:hypothetical protein
VPGDGFLPALHWIDTPVGGIQEEENLCLLDSHSVSKDVSAENALLVENRKICNKLSSTRLSEKLETSLSRSAKLYHVVGDGSSRAS